MIGFFWILSLIVIAIIADANDWFKEKESTTTTYTNTSLEPPRNEERLVFPVNNTASKKECNEAITIIKGELENSTRELLSINEQAKQAEFHGSGFTEIDKFTITQAILRSTALQTLFLEQIKQKLSSCEEVQRIGFLKQENEIIEGFTALGMFFNDEIDLYEVQNIIQPLSIAPPIQDSISTNSVINFRDAGKKEDSSFSVENFVSEIREEYPELDKIKITVTPFPFVNEEGSLRKYLGLYYHPEGQEPTLYLSNDIPEQRMRNVFFHEYCHHHYFQDLSEEERQTWELLFESNDYGISKASRENATGNFAEWCGFLLYQIKIEYMNFHLHKEVPQIQFIKEKFNIQ